jgi:hypothetical protein
MHFISWRTGMRFAATWIPNAEQRLASIWLAVKDRNAVTVAAHRLDQLLARNALAAGESRQTSLLRVAFENPLGIAFEVILDDRAVNVLSVWPMGPARNS